MFHVVCPSDSARRKQAWPGPCGGHSACSSACSRIQGTAGAHCTSASIKGSAPCRCAPGRTCCLRHPKHGRCSALGLDAMPRGQHVYDRFHRNNSVALSSNSLVSAARRRALDTAPAGCSPLLFELAKVRLPCPKESSTRRRSVAGLAFQLQAVWPAVLHWLLPCARQRRSREAR